MNRTVLNRFLRKTLYDLCIREKWRISVELLTEEELLEFERLCDAEGFSADKRLQIVRDVFGKTEARLYEERRCKVVTFAARENRMEYQGSR